MAVYLDTDIGSDIDDALALIYLIAQKVDIEMISTVHGPVEQRAKLASGIAMALKKDIDVYAGEMMPLKQKTIFTSGFEHKLYGLQPGNYCLGAVDELIKRLHRKPGDIISIGPLTNIGKAIQKDPTLVDTINHIYCMGNAIVREDEYILNYRSHNFKVDPEAVDIVFNSGVPITLMTTELCKQHSLGKKVFDELYFGSHKLFEYISRSLDDWLPFIGHDEIFLYDPLTVHQALYPASVDVVIYGNVNVSTRVGYDFTSYFVNTIRQLK